jgi:RimJ/RimL family protein N-acetyltransferase
VTQENTVITGLRPAKISDLDQIHKLLLQAIEESDFYNSTFKEFEKARLTKNYLLALFDEDPAHIMVMVDEDQPCGFMISGPELGTLWLYWSYLMPEHRKGLLAMSAMRTFIKHWDNGRFHKIATYTKDGNRPAEMIMKRAGYKHICTLKNHIFGEDYYLYERELTKISTGYDKGLQVSGRFGRFKQKLKKLLRL